MSCYNCSGCVQPEFYCYNMSDTRAQDLSEEEEARLSRWFRYLDVDEDGKISLTDLAKALKTTEFEGIHDSGHAQVCVFCFNFHTA